MKNIENMYNKMAKQSVTFFQAFKAKVRKMGKQEVVINKDHKKRVSCDSTELERMASGDDFSMALFIKENTWNGISKSELKDFATNMFNRGKFNESSLIKFMKELGVSEFTINGDRHIQCYKA